MPQNSKSPACENCFFLRDNPHLSPGTVQKLRALRTQREYQPKQAVLSQGAVPTSICCLANGAVSAQVLDNKGAPHLLFSFRGRGIFPLFAFFSRSPSQCEFIANRKTTICQFPIRAFDELMQKDSGLTRKLFETCSTQGSMISSRILSLLGKSAAKKVASVVFQSRDESGLCQLSRKEIAQWTNVAPETVIRALSALERQKLIRRQPKGIEVTNAEEMQRYLGLA
jgi:CRP-like cAMP-binding protein